MALFLVLNALAAYLAYLTSRRILLSAEWPTRLAAGGVIFVATIVLVAQVLSPFGLYNVVSAALLIGASTLIAQWTWGSHADIRSDAAALGRLVRAAARPGAAVLFVLMAIGLGVASWAALTRIPMGWDSLTYHLPFAASYVQTGRLTTLVGPMAMDHYAHFPKNGEILASWLMLPFHSARAVGLMNVGALAFAWLATCGLARELDVEPGDAALAATAVCTSPFLYSFATSQNADTLVFATLIAALLFLLRYLSLGRTIDGWLSCAAIGLAVGTKYTALPLSVLVLGMLAVAAVIKLRRKGRASMVPLYALVAITSVVALGGRQYVLNAMETGNPIYPLSATVAGHELLPGSSYTDWLVSDLGSGSRGDDRFQFSGMFHYYPAWKTPTSAGPKYVLLILLAAAAALLPGPRTGYIRLLLVFAAVGILAAELPSSGLPALSRRFWPGSASRLLGAYFGIFATVGATITTRLRHRQADILRAVLILFIVCDLVFARGVDADMAPTTFVAGWQFAEQVEPQTIAFATGDDLHGQNWFVYPLMGRVLQNTVVYVPLNQSDPPGSRAFVWRENPRLPEWLGALARRHVQLVCVQAPWPIEDQWMREDPVTFTRVLDDPNFRAYAVRAASSN